MQSTVGVVALLVGAVAVIAWAIHVAGPPRLSELFRFPQLGWPQGVQEDDDLHWEWRRPARVPGPATEPVRGRVRPADGTDR
jgi:hypothetical protein